VRSATCRQCVEIGAHRWSSQAARRDFCRAQRHVSGRGDAHTAAAPLARLSSVDGGRVTLSVAERTGDRGEAWANRGADADGRYPRLHVVFNRVFVATDIEPERISERVLAGEYLPSTCAGDVLLSIVAAIRRSGYVPSMPWSYASSSPVSRSVSARRRRRSMEAKHTAS